jgi:hypothetical protein
LEEALHHQLLTQTQFLDQLQDDEVEIKMRAQMVLQELLENQEWLEATSLQNQ